MKDGSGWLACVKVARFGKAGLQIGHPGSSSKNTPKNMFFFLWPKAMQVPQTAFNCFVHITSPQTTTSPAAHRIFCYPPTHHATISDTCLRTPTTHNQLKQTAQQQQLNQDADTPPSGAHHAAEAAAAATQQASSAKCGGAAVVVSAPLLPNCSTWVRKHKQQQVRHDRLCCLQLLASCLSPVMKNAPQRARHCCRHMFCACYACACWLCAPHVRLTFNAPLFPLSSNTCSRQPQQRWSQQQLVVPRAAEVSSHHHQPAQYYTARSVSTRVVTTTTHSPRLLAWHVQSNALVSKHSQLA